LVEVQRDGTAPLATPVPELIKSPKADVMAAAPATAAAPMAEKRAAATQLRAVRYSKTDDGYSITLSGNGPLLAAKVDEANNPERVLLDFHGVASGTAPAITNVKNDDID